MPRATHVQTNFTAGEISPRLLGRTDLNRYQNGLNTASNAIVYPHGMLARRPGTKFVAYTKGSAAARLIQFEYNDEQSYVLEAGDQYLRFYRDGIQITENLTSVTATFSALVGTYTKSGHRLAENDFVTVTGMSDSAYNVSGYITNVTATTWDMTLTSTPAGAGTGGTAAVPYDIASPWAAADIDTLKYVQSADTIFVCHPRYQPRVIERTGSDVFSVSTYELEYGPFETVPRETNFLLSTSGHDATLVDGTKYKDGQNANDYGGVKPTEHFSIKIIDDTMNWDHDGATGTTGTDIGRLIKFRATSAMDFLIAQIYQTISAKEAYAVLISNGSNWGFDGGNVLGRTTPGDDEFYVGDFYGAIDEGKHQVKTITSASWAAGTLTVTTDQKHCMDQATTESVTISGLESTTDVNGTYTATATGDNTFTCSTSDPGTVTASTGTASFPKFLQDTTQEGTTSSNYPSIPSFFQQRLFLANTPNNVNRIYASSTGDFGNFQDTLLEAPYDVLDTNALVLTIDDDQVNNIKWLRSVARGLVIGTAGAEYTLSGSNSFDVITPSNVRALRQTEFGSADGRIDTLIGRSILFAHRSGTRLIELSYSFDADQQIGNDVSIVSEHLLKQGVKEIAYQEVPVNILWIVRGDGKLVCLTYEKEQDVIGWTTGEFGGSGLAESVAVIPEADEDACWFIVNRNGTRFVEVMQAPVDIDTVQDDCWYVDAGLKLDNTNSTSSALIKYTGSYVAGGTGTLVATAHTPFAGTAADVGKRFRLYASDDSFYEFDVTGAISASQCDVKLVTSGLPTELQNTNTANWAELTLTASGLDHLEGQTLKVLADGGVHDDVTVSGGSVTFNDYVGKAIIGHGYSSVMEGLPVRVLQYFTETRGKVQSLYKAEIQLWRSLGGLVSFDGNTGVELDYRVPEEAFGAAPRLTSAVVDVTAPNSYDTRQSLKVTTSDPVPFNLLAVTYELDINEQV